MTITAPRRIQEYSDLEYLLLGDLRELLEQPLNDDEDRRWLVAVLDELLETLECEFCLEEDGGYMTDVLDIWPNWSGQVDRLFSEHETLCSQLKRLRYRLAEALPLKEVAESLRHQLRDWMTTLTAHHRHENRLIQEAFVFDVGTGD